MGDLTDLAARLMRGAYRPAPIERTYIPKPDGRQRPIGKGTMEDKIVQRAFSEVIGEVYEADFLGFSYGCRPGRSPHRALDALSVALERKCVNWVLDADIRGFLETATHYTPSDDAWGARFPGTCKQLYFMYLCPDGVS